MRTPVAPENGPAPTPARAVYGFLLCVCSALSAAVYVTWALVPPGWLRALGLDYWPQQLWALTVPTSLLAALFLFVLVIYPLLGLLDAPGLHEARVHTDQFSLPAAAAAGDIPPVCDIPLSEACRHLYLHGPPCPPPPPPLPPESAPPHRGPCPGERHGATAQPGYGSVRRRARRRRRADSGDGLSADS